MKDIRIAMAVVSSAVGRIGANLDAMHHWIGFARKKEADLICFPEMNITGYGIKPGLMDIARTLDDPVIGEIRDWAVKYRMVILTGMAEKDDQNQIFSTHLVITPNNTVGFYRKTHLGPPERGMLTAGNKVPLFKVNGVTFGIQLCYDAHFPELSTRMALKGADVIFFPHASPRGTSKEKMASWMRHIPARSFDNGIFTAAVNIVGSNGQDLNFPGTALAINPSGQVIGSYAGNRQTCLIADLSADELKKVRNHRMRYFLPHRRPELYG